ncbi:Asp23/Gls24 family envelope stress response protein [Peptostreptococcus faecalis]|uniref:Asp23/Gls24 family envelope stress response protein n=1 Tax=Peptostreptococcus faecalis TaxID=2045015 RepID=UPI000C7CAE67|nr:Asp23/Gls24 family envelope stress response protein [Peptostreptococcus faecalis]
MENLGQVKIANDVIQTIAGYAALEIDGIDKSVSLTDKLFRNNGVKAVIEDNKAVIDIDLTVKYGEVIPEVCYKVQENIINAVESMAGLKVSQVNVHIFNIDLKKEVVEKEKKENA